MTDGDSGGEDVSPAQYLENIASIFKNANAMDDDSFEVKKVS